MPIDHHLSVSGSRNDDVERDLVWLQRKLNVATYHDVEDVRCAVIVLKRWARMQRLNTSAKKFVGYLHYFLKSAHIIQRAYRRYKFRRSWLLERHRIKWTSTWSHMLTEEADRHRADTRKLLTDKYKKCIDVLPPTWKAGDVAGNISGTIGGEKDMGEIKTLFDGALKMATASTSQYEVDALCLMEAIMSSYQEAIIRFRYKYRALRTNNSAYFEAVSSAPNVLVLSALRKEGDVVTSPLANGREFPVVFFDDYGAKVSRGEFDSILNSLNLFADSLGNFTETRARYDVVVFANAVRDLGRALGEHSTESVQFLLGLANRALDDSVRAAPLPEVPLRRLTNSMFPELRTLVLKDGSPPSNRPMVKRLSAYSMRHFVHATPVPVYPPSDDDDEGDTGTAEDNDGPFARTASEKRRAAEMTAAEKWEALYEALPVAGPFREKVPWTARLQAYSRLRRAKLTLGEKSVAAAAAACTPSKCRRRSSSIFVESPSATTPQGHPPGAARRVSLNSSQHSDVSVSSVRRSSLIPVGNRKLPPNRSLHDDSPSFQFGSVPVNNHSDDEEGRGDGDGDTATRVPSVSKRSRRPSTQHQQAASPHTMTSFLERHARIHSTRSLMEKKAIGQRMNGVVWKGRGGNSNDSQQHLTATNTGTSPLRTSFSPATLDGFRPASPWGVPQLRYDIRGPQCRVLPHSNAKRVADGGRSALNTSSSPSKRNNNPPPLLVSLDSEDYLAPITTTTPSRNKSKSTTPPRNRSPSTKASSSPQIRPLTVAERKKVVARLINPRPTTTPLVSSEGVATANATPLKPVLSEGLFTSTYARELLNNSYPSTISDPVGGGSPSVGASSRPGTGLASRLRPVDIQHRKLGYKSGTTPSPDRSREVADRIRTANPRWNSPHRPPPHESPAIYTGLNWHAIQSTPPSSLSSMLLKSTALRPSSPATPEVDRVRKAYHSHIKSL